MKYNRGRPVRFCISAGLLICVMLFTALIPLTARADTGPKPSVIISFENMGDELCYGTLLSQRESTGPSSAWDGDEEHAHYGYYGEDIWEAFVKYEDADGYYFLQEIWRVDETKLLDWTYYPPDSFKLLLYYPDTQSFVSSGICERYAFDSYFTVNMNGVDISSVTADEPLIPHRSYDYSKELLSLGARIVITIAIEMLIALLFGFRKKKQLLLLIGVNTATQIILNVLLNLINYNSGYHAFVFFYIVLEIAVFIIEAVLYCALMNKLSEKKRGKGFYIAYSFAANVVSFAAGINIAKLIPGIF